MVAEDVAAVAAAASLAAEEAAAAEAVDVVAVAVVVVVIGHKAIATSQDFLLVEAVGEGGMMTVAVSAGIKARKTGLFFFLAVNQFCVLRVCFYRIGRGVLRCETKGKDMVSYGEI